LWLRLVRRRNLGRSLFAAVFPEFIAREKPGQRGTGRQGRSAGLVRPAAQRGLGPARLDGQAPRATVAGKSDELGERRTAADGPGRCAETNAARRAPLRASGTPSWLAVGRSGATCSAAFEGRQARRGGDGLPSRSPGGQASRAGQEPAKRRPETSGIKAAWPRLGTRRGATPASPTAARRDAMPHVTKSK
jgi:hypothetical protein